LLSKIKKRKKRKANPSIKFELYGIIILIFAIITLSDEGRVARVLTYLFRFLLGESGQVIPVIFIYIGLYAMMKRSWPDTWSKWKTSMAIILAGWILLNEITNLGPLNSNQDLKVPADIIKSSWTAMQNSFLPHGSGQLLSSQLGGGMIGALLYAGLYFLFGYFGAYLIAYCAIIIGILLITNISLVHFFSKIYAKTSESFAGLSQSIHKLFSPKKGVKLPRKDVFLVDEDHAMKINYKSQPAKEKHKPLFFELSQSEHLSGLPQEDEDENSDTKLLTPPAKDQDNANIPEVDEPLPYIRDFQNHIEPTKETQATTEIKRDEPPMKRIKPYVLPSFQLLSKPVSGKSGDVLDFKASARKLEATLESFGVKAKVLEIVRGPSVTRYELHPDVGVKISRIVSLTDDIALALAAKDIRMEAPIPGKSAIGIEVPNTEISLVTLREVMESTLFRDSKAKLPITLGRDLSGQPIVANLVRMPHLLVAGATGSGKSVCINGIIMSILYKAKPDEVKFLMIDPKKVELNIYNGIPHLLAPVVTDPRRASLALKKIVVEMERRYELFSNSGTRNIEGYNNLLAAAADHPANTKPTPPLPLIVVIVDELADLMMVAAGDVEDSICRLAQMARAAGIHLIIATQRPSVDVITGIIKANIPSRIAFSVSSMVDSRTILDSGGAEKLLGRGDMLYLPVDSSKPIRIQGAYLTDQEVESVVEFVRDQEKAVYQEELVPELDEQSDAPSDIEDELYSQAVQIVIEAKQASVSLLQRRMRIGYTRAARMIDAMEAKGIVGPYEGSKPREVNLTMEQFQNNRLLG